uniref:Uncharacterized protein n=1 Tax=Timema shepardi TaxID=629360 RepID=A0A7R9B2R6_TIMSH|nr:unnamed protein product [Timema shepardi]
MTARLVNSSSSSNSSNRSTSSKSSGGHQEKKSKGGGGGGGSSSTTSAAGVSGGGLPNLAPSVGGVAGAVRPTDGRRECMVVSWSVWYYRGVYGSIVKCSILTREVPHIPSRAKPPSCAGDTYSCTSSSGVDPGDTRGCKQGPHSTRLLRDKYFTTARAGRGGGRRGTVQTKAAIINSSFCAALSAATAAGCAGTWHPPP